MPETVINPPDQRTKAYRLVKEKFADEPLSAAGARKYGGRWNPPGIGILYTSSSPELALLEQLVHLPALLFSDLPKLFLIALSFPGMPNIPVDLSPEWREATSYKNNHPQIHNWLHNPDVLALSVPSAVVAESNNYLLHPLHPDFARIEVVSISPFNIDRRLW